MDIIDLPNVHIGIIFILGYTLFLMLLFAFCRGAFRNQDYNKSPNVSSWTKIKTEFESDYLNSTHTIKSNNLLVCSDTGRVIAVFYNGYDLDELLSQISNNLMNKGDKDD